MYYKEDQTQNYDQRGASFFLSHRFL